MAAAFRRTLMQLADDDTDSDSAGGHQLVDAVRRNRLGKVRSHMKFMRQCAFVPILNPFVLETFEFTWLVPYDMIRRMSELVSSLTI